MSIVRTTRRMLLLAVPLVLPGCAAAYHDYPCGCVPYAYCPPPPLPYVTYSHCGCPTPIAAQRHQGGSAAAENLQP